MSSYGFCPICDAPGVTRERRPNGNDECAKGHRYPSRNALPEKESHKNGSESA